MYPRVKTRPGGRHLYAQHLIREGVITDDGLNEMTNTVVEKYEGILARAKQIASEIKPKKTELDAPVVEEDGSKISETGASTKELRSASEKISLVPEGFHINPKMVGQLARRAKMGAGEAPMDWGLRRRWQLDRLCLKDFLYASADKIRAAA